LLSLTVSDKITLRSYTLQDAAELFQLVQASRSHLNPWLNWVKGTTREEHSFEFIQGTIHKAEIQEALTLGIFYQGKLVGSLGMHNWTREINRAELGYWLTQGYEGKGIIHQSTAAFVDFLFAKVGLSKLEIHFAASNLRSGKVAQRLNFKLEGVIRQSIVRNGLPEDLVITGLLRSEWVPRV